MQTPVRFYITQNDDQPVVRTIPVARQTLPDTESIVVTARDEQATPVRDSGVTGRVRTAILRRAAAPTK